MEHVVADVVDHFGSCVCNPPRLPGSSTRPNLCQVIEQMPKVLRRVGMHVGMLARTQSVVQATSTAPAVLRERPQPKVPETRSTGYMSLAIAYPGCDSCCS